MRVRFYSGPVATRFGKPDKEGFHTVPDHLGAVWCKSGVATASKKGAGVGPVKRKRTKKGAQTAAVEAETETR